MGEEYGRRLYGGRVAANRRRRRRSVHFRSDTDNWATPPDLFEELHREFVFELDVCASEDNAKCERFYTRADDGLRQPWSGVCWMNPPYGRTIGQWNRYEITLQGKKLSVAINGEKINEAWGLDDVAGPIGLQSEGAEIHFRKVELTPLKSP